MDLVVAVAIAVLSLIFLGSMVALLIICRQKYCLKPAGDEKPILKYTRDHAGDLPGNDNAGLAGNSSGGAIEHDFEDMLQLSPSIEKYLKDYDWVYDASGLVRHCLAILKTCHQVTDRLSAMSFTPIHGNQAVMDEVRDATRRVMPRVDDLVRTMYASDRKSTIGPLSPLLEARAAALVLALSAVAIAFKAAYPRARGDTVWLTAAMTELDGHLEALRLAAQYAEQSEREKVEMVLPSQQVGDPEPPPEPDCSPRVTRPLAEQKHTHPFV